MRQPTPAALLTVRLLALGLLLLLGAQAWSVWDQFFHDPRDLAHGRPYLIYPVFERCMFGCSLAPVLLLLLLARPVASHLTSGTLPGTAVRILTMILRTAVLLMGTFILQMWGMAQAWRIVVWLTERGFYTPSGSFIFGVNEVTLAIASLVPALAWWAAPYLGNLATRLGSRILPARWCAPRPC